jgi:hypothetical protein
MLTTRGHLALTGDPMNPHARGGSFRLPGSFGLAAHGADSRRPVSRPITRPVAPPQADGE